jgi:hypothetical protein
VLCVLLWHFVPPFLKKKKKKKSQTWVDDFSPSVDSGAFLDHCNVFKSRFNVTNLIVEFNVLSISGLGVEFDISCAEISLLSHHKTSKIATSRKNQKI